MASRHLSRSIAMQTLYEWDFYGKKLDNLESIKERNIEELGVGLKDTKFICDLVKGVKNHLPEIGAWKEIIIDFLDNVDVWTFVREIGRHQDIIESM